METMLVVAIVVGSALFVGKKASRTLSLFRRGAAPRNPGSPGGCGSCSGCASRCTNDVNRVLVGATLLLVAGGTATAHAADTVETWDVGATDVDVYIGAESLGLSRQDGVVFGDVMAGYGFADRFSGYFGTTLQADRTLGQGDHQLYLGLFGTPFASDHVDIDVFLDFTGSASDLTVTPSFELNLDRDPDMSSYGFYFRSGVVFEHEPADPGTPGSEPGIGTVLEFNPGLYWSLTARSQILLEYGTGYLPSPAADEPRWDDGHMYLGHNFLLTDTMELVSEINWALSTTDGVTPWGGFVGVIVTLPSAGNEG